MRVDVSFDCSYAFDAAPMLIFSWSVMPAEVASV